MEEVEQISRWEKSLEELEKIYQKIVVDNKVDVSGDNMYLAITFVSKIYGINSIFSSDFIKKNNLAQVVKWIDTEVVKIQAEHYGNKALFYEFFQVIYPQLKYRFSQIKYKYSLSKEEREKLIITPEYHVYLSKLLKYYLEQQSDEKTNAQMKEILSFLNLYEVCDQKDMVCLGSDIVYMDSLTNEPVHYKIVIPSHENEMHKKISIYKAKQFLHAKKGDIIYLDFSTSYFIRILDVVNEEEPVTF